MKNISFLQGSPSTNMSSLIPINGAFYLTNDISNNFNSNRLYIGRETGIKPVVTPTPFPLTIQGDGKTLTNGIYDGSSAKTINITPASIGAVAVSTLNNYYTKTEIDNTVNAGTQIQMIIWEEND